MKRILIVEDNFDNLSIYKAVLSHVGFDVLEAKDGPTGLEMAATEQPDLILMDISIPGIDGWEVTSQLRNDERTSRIPIIVLTAHALASDRQRAYDVGATGYIAKPANPMTVANAVRQTLDDPKLAVGFEGMPSRS